MTVACPLYPYWTSDEFAYLAVAVYVVFPQSEIESEANLYSRLPKLPDVLDGLTFAVDEVFPLLLVHDDTAYPVLAITLGGVTLHDIFDVLVTVHDALVLLIAEILVPLVNVAVKVSFVTVIVYVLLCDSF